jgi:transposase InsO family protein
MKNPTEYVKMRVLAAIDMAEGKTITERIRAVSELTFEDEEGQSHRFTFRTIETWRLRYKKHGFTAICPKERSDKGKTRKVSPEQLLEAIEQVKPFFRGQRFNLAELYRRCIEKGLLRREQVAPNTFRRLVNQLELLKPDKDATNKLRLAFAKRHANEAWQSDTLFGPRVATPGGRFVQSKLIAFVDDASRICCHGQFFAEENSPAFKTALKRAFYKRGLPQMLYVDNGSIYSSAELSAICTRLGVRLCHTPVRDGAAKGKVERFFRTVRDQFLIRQLDLSSIDVLNEQFIAWAEDEYNHRHHSTLGMKPVERYALDRERVQYLPPNQYAEELFMMEESRGVGADNTFSYNRIRYEAPADLRRKTIHIRYNKAPTGQKVRPPKRIPVYYKGNRIGQAKALDRVANDRAPAPLHHSTTPTKK